MLLNNLLSKLCTPDPNYIEDTKERGLLALKIKAQVCLYSLIITILTIQAITRMFPLQIQLIKIFCFSSLLVSLLTFCRTHLHIYYTMMTLYISFLPMISAAGGETFFSMGAVFVGTIFLYVATDTWYYYMSAVVAHLFTLNLFVKHNIEENIFNLTPGEFSGKMITAFSIQLCVMACFLCPVHIAMKNLKSELFESKVEAEGSLSHYKTFLFSFSHEIRNPINILLGSIELTLQEKLPSSAVQMIETAKISTELLLQLINNVLDVGKAEVGKLEIVPSPTPVYDLLLRMWNISAELIRKKGLFGYLKISTDIPNTIRIDPDRLNQVLLNLLGNAIKFTKTGTINLQVDWLANYHQVCEECFEPKPFEDSTGSSRFTSQNADDCDTAEIEYLDERLFHRNQSFTTLAYTDGLDPGELHNYYVLTHLQKKNNIREKLKARKEEARYVSNKGRQGVLRITVSDQGCGMSKEAMNGLFKKFYQCSNEASQRKKGTGLGLYITKDICESMGGEIRVYSKENVGSVFMACIPSQEMEDEY